MIEFEHLFQFVAFGMYGTLSKTAEILHVSQPTLTRNMKLLEKEFGVIQKITLPSMKMGCLP